MKNIKYFIIIFFLINDFSILSQTTFSKTLNVTNGNEGSYTLLLNNNNYYIVGSGIVFDTIDNKIYYSEKFYMLKLDSTQNIVQHRVFNQGNAITNLIIHNDTLYAFGQEQSSFPYFWRVYKFNKNLDSLDLLIYNHFKLDARYAITMQIKDNYLYLGSYPGDITDDSGVLIIKSNKKGKIIKEEKFAEYLDLTKQYIIRDLVQTSDGQFAFVHWHELDSMQSGLDQIGIIKFDENMDVILAKDLPPNRMVEWGDSKLPNLTVTKDGGMVVSSGISLYDSIRKQPDIYGEYGIYNILFQKLDKDGNIVWEDISYNLAPIKGRYSPTVIENVKKLITARNGDIIAAGIYDHPFYEPGTKGWLCRYSPAGKMKWKHYYVDPKYNYGYSFFRDMHEAENGDIICVGELNESRKFNDIDTWLLRVDSNGCVTPGCECVPDSNTRVWATTEAYKILVNTPNVWYQADWSISGQDVLSSRYKLSYYLIKNNYAFGVLKSDEPTGENWDATGILLRQVGGKVWMYEDNDDPPHYDYKLLYDFTLEKGDTFRSEIFEDDEFYLLVEETDTVIMMDGTKRKRLKLSCNNESDTVNYSDYELRTWIEGIGDTKGLLSVAEGCIKDQSSSLLCFHQKGKLLWDNPDQDGCWITGTEEIVENAFDVYPNPTKEMIKVTLPENNNWQRWSIYDLNGKLLKNGSINNSFDFTISGLKELGSGMYFLKVYDGQDRVGIGKFVVE